MNILFKICVSLSIGVVIGILLGGLKQNLKKNYSEKSVNAYQKLWKISSRILTFLTGILLCLGLIWCLYFLIMGIVHPSLADYADNMSELIVSVLTVVSIIFAFFEFLRRK